MSCRCLHNRACASLDLPSHGKQLLPGEPPGAMEGFVFFYGYDLVDQLSIQDFRDKSRTNSLNTMRRSFTTRKYRRGFWLNCY